MQILRQESLIKSNFLSLSFTFLYQSQSQDLLKFSSHSLTLALKFLCYSRTLNSLCRFFLIVKYRSSLTFYFFSFTTILDFLWMLSKFKLRCRICAKISPFMKLNKEKCLTDHLSNWIKTCDWPVETQVENLFFHGKLQRKSKPSKSGFEKEFERNLSLKFLLSS